MCTCGAEYVYLGGYAGDWMIGRRERGTAPMKQLGTSCS